MKKKINVPVYDWENDDQLKRCQCCGWAIEEKMLLSPDPETLFHSYETEVELARTKWDDVLQAYREGRLGQGEEAERKLRALLQERCIGKLKKCRSDLIAISHNGLLGTIGTGYEFSTPVLIKLWRISDQKHFRTIKCFSAPLHSLAFSTDGKLLAAGVRDQIIIWRTGNSERLGVLTNHNSSFFIYGSVHSLAFSNNGEFIVSANDRVDPEIRLWRVSDGVCVDTWEDDDRCEYRVAFSDNGVLLACGNTSDTIKLVRISDSERVCVHRDIASRVLSCAFSPNGKLIATGHVDGSIRLWPVPGRDRDEEPLYQTYWEEGMRKFQLEHTYWLKIGENPKGDLPKKHEKPKQKSIQAWEV